MQFEIPIAMTMMKQQQQSKRQRYSEVIDGTNSFPSIIGEDSGLQDPKRTRSVEDYRTAREMSAASSLDESEMQIDYLPSCPMPSQDEALLQVRLFIHRYFT